LAHCIFANVKGVVSINKVYWRAALIHTVFCAASLVPGV